MKTRSMTLLLALPMLVWSQIAVAGEAGRFLGSADAPVTIIEYASLSCTHCAAFHRDRLPWLKENYIDTGKVRLEFRDFPLNRPGLFGAMVAHCVDSDDYFDMLNLLFARQEEWAFGDDPVAALKPIAKDGGLSSRGFDRCMKNTKLQNRIIQARAHAQKEYEIRATPSIIIGTRLLESVPSIELLAESIELATK